MNIVLWIARRVEIEDDINAFHIYAAAQYVGRYQYIGLAVAVILHDLLALLLLYIAAHHSDGQVFAFQHAVQIGYCAPRRTKYNDALPLPPL